MADTEVIKTVVVKREDAMTRSVAVSTPGEMPNIVVRALSPLRIIAVRASRVYVQGIVGFLGGQAIGVLPEALSAPGGFWHKLSLASQLAIAPAALCLLQNIGELLARLDEKAPEWRG